ncbi:MAG TPA: FAD-binding oxidoreductase [Steroidobacteraceae bacterium]|nr:FAD-binding oxidoreductase [Steroidobacteraceae bacterium]
MKLGRLALALLLAACTAPPVTAPERTSLAPIELNDVHSRLNATVVRELVQPATLAELPPLIARAARDKLAISISGGRHAMGGQQFARDALHIDMSKLARVIKLDRQRGVVTVEAGIGWPALIEELLEMQADDPQPWSIVQKQTGADALSIGGALSANAHGRGLTWKPFVQDVLGFRLLQADGREIEVSRTQHPELFRLVVGGYGLFGIVTTVDLQLQRRMKLRRDVVVLPLSELPQTFAARIRDGYLYGDFQFKTDERADDFLTVGVLSAYQPVSLDTPMASDQLSLSPGAWRQLFALAHLDKARAFETYRDYYLSTNGQIYWSDTHQLSYYDAEFDADLRRLAPDYPAGSLMISELYVPMAKLGAFLDSVARDIRAHDTNLIYGTVRLIRRDDDSFLAWAREDFACIVMNLRVAHTDAGLQKAQWEFQRLIDFALEQGGSYFLTYHRWARKDQVLRAYPQFIEFLKLKRHYDPDERFQSEWYRHYRTMFATELSAP